MKFMKVIAPIIVIAVISYLAIICSTPEYSGLQIKVSRNLAGLIGYQNLIMIIVSMYIIAITKEILTYKLWLKYKQGLWVSIKTTIMILFSPIISISLIYNYDTKEN